MMFLRPSSFYNKCLSFSAILSFELAVLHRQPEFSQTSRGAWLFFLIGFIHDLGQAQSAWALGTKLQLGKFASVLEGMGDR